MKEKKVLIIITVFAVLFFGITILLVGGFFFYYSLYLPSNYTGKYVDFKTKYKTIIGLENVDYISSDQFQERLKAEGFSCIELHEHSDSEKDEIIWNEGDSEVTNKFESKHAILCDKGFEGLPCKTYLKIYGDLNEEEEQISEIYLSNNMAACL